jgi:hypothetical protein
MPTFPDLLAMGAAVFGVATWIIPLLRFLLQDTKPRHPSQVRVPSLVKVGRVIGFVMLAACLSAAGLLLALPAFVFAEQTGWAWLGLGAIVGFWFALAAFIGIGSQVARRKQREVEKS